MRGTQSKLTEKLLVIYEMEGDEAVTAYARQNGIPLAGCRKRLADSTVARGLRVLAAGG
jgi:hypothetical protein